MSNIRASRGSSISSSANAQQARSAYGREAEFNRQFKHSRSIDDRQLPLATESRGRATTLLGESPSYDRRKFESSDEADYMDMTGKKTSLAPSFPSHSPQRSHTVASRNPVRSDSCFTSSTRRYAPSPYQPSIEDDPDYVTVTSPESKAFNATSRFPDHSPAKNVVDDEDIYTDMTGNGVLSNSASQTNSPARLSTPSRSGKFSKSVIAKPSATAPHRHPSSASASLRMRRSESGNLPQAVRQVSSIKAKSSSTSCVNVPSASSFTTQKVIPTNIVEGSFNKNDDEDYDEMPISSTKPLNPQSSQQSTQRYPAVEVRPATPTTSGRERSRSSKTPHEVMRNRYFGYSDDESDSGAEADRSAFLSDHGENSHSILPSSKHGVKSKSVGAIYDQPEALAGSYPESRPAATDAGRAARKYLQQKDTKLSPVSVEARPGQKLVRSPSRASQSGGVKSRINKVKQNNYSPRIVTESEDQVDSPSSAAEQVPIRPKSNVSARRAVGGHDRRKSQTLDQSLHGFVAAESESHRNSGRDQYHLGGAPLMKMLASQSRSQSLNKEYLQWLAETSPYASRHSSTNSSGRPTRRKDLSKSSADDLTSDDSINTDESEEDDVAFARFAQAVEKNQQAQQCTKETLRLSDYAEKHFQGKETSKKATLTPSTKAPGSIGQEVKTLIKAKTPAPAALEELQFSEKAKAFHEDYVSKQKKKDSKKSQKTDKNKDSYEKSSKSLKKSFRFGSKKKFNKNKSCPALDIQESQKPKSLSLPPADNDVISSSLASGLNNIDVFPSPESLKPPSGIPPSSGSTGSIRRQRASSQSQKKHQNLKSNRDKARTLDRGLTYSRHCASTNDVRVDEDSKTNSMKLQISEADLDRIEAASPSMKLSASKSSTLGRLFSRKGKERKGMDVVDTFSLVDVDQPDPNAQLDDESADLTPSQLYFRKSHLWKGLCLDSQGEEGVVICALVTEGAVKSFHSNHRYATITGVYRSGLNREQRPKLPTRHLSADNNLKVDNDDDDDDEEIVEESLRNKRSRSSLRGLSSSLSRNLYKSVTKQHLTSGKSDELNGDDASRSASVQAPLERRTRAKVGVLYSEPRSEFLDAARRVLKHLSISKPCLLREHKADEETGYNQYYTDDECYQRCAMGRDLVTWLQNLLQPTRSVGEDGDAPLSRTYSRYNICGMWQVLHEEGLIYHVRREQHFEDDCNLYQFHEDVTSYVDKRVTDSSTSTDGIPSARSSIDSGIGHLTNESSDESITRAFRSASLASNSKVGESVSTDVDFMEAITLLQQNSADALFRRALRKLPNDRSSDELMTIYEEILHIKALANLSDSIKRELAGVLQFECHQEKGKTLFHQGDEGRSWYIILKGSVSVAIHGKGVVCTLREGDDFGNLAIINDAPRAATIVLSEENCQFLRVDKFDFVRILKDVEANTVRLREHEEVVLILQKIPPRTLPQSSRAPASEHQAPPPLPVAATPTRQCHRYAISAGTAEKILEHILDYLQPWNTAQRADSMEDYIIMHQVFISTEKLCQLLMQHYRSEDVENSDFAKSLKRRVIYFTVRWSHIGSYLFSASPAVQAFLANLRKEVALDSESNSNFAQLKDELESLYTVGHNNDDVANKRALLTVRDENIQRFQANPLEDKGPCLVKASDEILLKVYSMGKTYTTVKVLISSKPSEVLTALREKLSKNLDGYVLVELQEDRDAFQIPDRQSSIATYIKVNSRLFVCKASEIEQLGNLNRTPPPSLTTTSHMEEVSSLELAFHATQYDWELINNVHVMEFVYKIFGAHKFHAVTPNLDIFTRRFNQLAYWAPTEICSCPNLNKRVQLLRKFIKIAYHLKSYQNMNGFMAMMIGIGNQAVSRLYNTWDKLPAKYKKQVQDFESILDPSRNHRSYRLYVSSLQPPVILYLPLLLKDMTFQHEGNDTINNNGLINFEKMHMLGNSIRSVVEGCSKKIDKDQFLKTTKTAEESRLYVRNIQVITNQKLLNEMSLRLEPRR